MARLLAPYRASLNTARATSRYVQTGAAIALSGLALLISGCGPNWWVGGNELKVAEKTANLGSTSFKLRMPFLDNEVICIKAKLVNAELIPPPGFGGKLVLEECGDWKESTLEDLENCKINGQVNPNISITLEAIGLLYYRAISAQNNAVMLLLPTPLSGGIFTAMTVKGAECPKEAAFNLEGSVGGRLMNKAGKEVQAGTEEKFVAFEFPGTPLAQGDLEGRGSAVGLVGEGKQIILEGTISLELQSGKVFGFK